MTVIPQRPMGSGFTAESTSEDVMSGVDLHGRTALVTGGYSGLGRQTTMSLAAAGANVIVPARRLDVAMAALGAVPRTTVIGGIDLEDLGSVERTAESVAQLTNRLDILVTAAGVMATPHRLVGPGWDHQLTVNHLAHFALVNHLYPLLAEAAGEHTARVVVYSSTGHHLSDIRWSDPHLRTGYDKWISYGQSKTANALFALHLDALAKTSGVRAFSLHPGKILTGLQRHLDVAEQVEKGWIDDAGRVVDPGFKSPAQGAATALWAATSPLLDGCGGLYLENCDIANVTASGGTVDDGGVAPHAMNSDAAERLWQMSTTMTARHGRVSEAGRQRPR